MYEKNNTNFRFSLIKRLIFLGLFGTVGFLCVAETPVNHASERALSFDLKISHVLDKDYPAKLPVDGNAVLSQNTKTLKVDVVKDFGATGNGINDDTIAIQNAINTVYQQGGGAIVFPPGVYVVTSVTLKDNITYEGYGATIKRPAMQGKWTRTFNTDYQGDTNSNPLIIKGFTFDGNSQNQGSYRNYELEQAHLIFLEAHPNFPGKLQAVIEDCHFKNGVADAISVYTNVDVKVKNIEVSDVFRGGFVLIGGNSSAEVYNLTTRGKTDRGGIDIEVDGKGYGDSLRVDVKLDTLNLIDGDFDIAVEDESTILGNNIISDAPFYLFSLKSTMKFTNSKFKVGAIDGYDNRILFPYDVTFENCEIYVTRKETGNPYKFLSTADVWWQHRGYPIQQNQTLTFKNVQFKVDSNIQPTDTTYAIYLRKDLPASNNQIILQGVTMDDQFSKQIVKEN
jgi:hypothetical protein